MSATNGARQSSNEASQRRSEAIAGLQTETRKPNKKIEIHSTFLFLLNIRLPGLRPDTTHLVNVCTPSSTLFDVQKLGACCYQMCASESYLSRAPIVPKD